MALGMTFLGRTSRMPRWAINGRYTNGFKIKNLIIVKTNPIIKGYTLRSSKSGN